MIEKNGSMSYEKKTCKKMCTRSKGGNTDLPSISLSSNLLCSCYYLLVIYLLASQPARLEIALATILAILKQVCRHHVSNMNCQKSK